ncbi:type II secretion system F family protein [Ornithinimicrobium cryptoxanthini]|uniref:Type II secretion system F family protein n=1 Tax=Ornithinimicrobium cryptoxanthini TaxID=2934161 RepID=A0ABY4YM39_9MICO|nr:type II secretion system F family protein [Ornithinimicrobium cryptoxanthini]USQ77783.1 type II secretion system F family protein [Ornithinimicrobium cryptoxanthini]
MSTLIVAVAGALVAGGALMTVLGLARRPVAPATPARSRRAGRFHLDRAGRVRALIGLGIGALIAVLTGWLIALIVTPLALVGIPVLLAAPPAEREIDRIEAMEEWVRTLAGSLGAGVGLEQALIRSLRSTPDPIRAEVTRLTSRLRARWRTEDALRAFADDLDDATGDLIASNLLLGANRRGGGLATVLEGLAESVGQDVHNRREIEADRSKPRSNARIITLITLVVLGGLAVSGDYITPYGTPLGQVLLATYLGLYVAMLAWLRKMAQGRAMPRFVGASVREQVS